MKIYFDGVNFSSRSGPNSFGTRLAKAMANRGHVIADPDDYDVALCFIEKTHRVNTQKPFVQRLDGIWFKPEELHVKNVGIKKTYDEAQAVIFQSRFDQRQITGWWGDKELETVIYNGVDPEEVKAADRAGVNIAELRDRFQCIFVCSSNWHAQKRFIDNVNLFAHLRKPYPYSCLVILGNNPPIHELQQNNIDHNVINNIFFAGSQPHDACLKIYKEADFLFHLAWLDHCPNVVCEALACGTPVVCAADGGTAELVLDYGAVLKDDVAYKFQAVDYDKPPRIDVTQLHVFPPLNEIARLQAKERVNLNNIAKQYEDILQEVL